MANLDKPPETPDEKKKREDEEKAAFLEEQRRKDAAKQNEQEAREKLKNELQAIGVQTNALSQKLNVLKNAAEPNISTNLNILKELKSLEDNLKEKIEKNFKDQSIPATLSKLLQDITGLIEADKQEINRLILTTTDAAVISRFLKDPENIKGLDYKNLKELVLKLSPSDIDPLKPGITEALKEHIKSIPPLPPMHQWIKIVQIHNDLPKLLGESAEITALTVEASKSVASTLIKIAEKTDATLESLIGKEQSNKSVTLGVLPCLQKLAEIIRLSDDVFAKNISDTISEILLNAYRRYINEKFKADTGNDSLFRLLNDLGALLNQKGLAKEITSKADDEVYLKIDESINKLFDSMEEMVKARKIGAIQEILGKIDNFMTNNLKDNQRIEALTTKMVDILTRAYTASMDIRWAAAKAEHTV